MMCLQLREDGSGAGPEGLSQGGIESHLAYAESCLVNGQLSTAAAHIQKLVQVGVNHIQCLLHVSHLQSGKSPVNAIVLKLAVHMHTWCTCTACTYHHGFSH